MTKVELQSSLLVFICNESSIEQVIDSMTLRQMRGKGKGREQPFLGTVYKKLGFYSNYSSLSLFNLITLFAIALLLGGIGLKLFLVVSERKVEEALFPSNNTTGIFGQNWINYLENSHQYVGPYEAVGRIASSALILPIFVSYHLDRVITLFYPILVEKSTFEDTFGDSLILCALLLASHLPIFLLGSAKSFAKDLLSPLHCLLIVAGVLDKLLHIAGDVWSENDCLLALAYELCLQLIIVSCFQYDSLNSPYFSEIFLVVISIYRFFEFLLYAKIVSKLPNLYKDDHQNSRQQFFVTRKYLCTVLVIGIIVHKSCLMIISLSYLFGPVSYDLSVGISYITFLIAVVILIVLPGKVIRRMVLVMEHQIAIQHKIDQKKAFIRYVSQEIRSSLSTTSLGVDCLYSYFASALDNQRKDFNIEDVLELARDCHLSCGAAMNTLNDLLLFDKIESNMLQLEKKEIACREFLEDFIRPCVRQVQQAGTTSSIAIDPHLVNYCVCGDEFLLTQVMRNLVGNAMKFTSPDGSLQLSAKLVKDHRSYRMRIELIDTGSGVSPENQWKIFEKYVQIRPSILQGGKGAGLGLWLSSAIIKMHDGKIGVFSPGEGQGSTFYFEIPVKRWEDLASSTITNMSEEGTPTESLEPKSVVVKGKEEYQKSKQAVLLHASLAKKIASDDSMQDNTTPLKLVDLPQGGSPSSSVHSTDVARKIKVLIADDSLLTRKMVERVLKPFDMSIHHCSNGKEAVDKVLEFLKFESTPIPRTTSTTSVSSIQQESAVNHDPNSLSRTLDPSLFPAYNPFDIVIIDYMMPGLDGAEAIGKMREGGFKGFICAVTGSSAAEDRERLYSSGASIIMGKPFNMRSFFNHMKVFFGKG